MWYNYREKTTMKKIVLLLSAFALLAGCSNEVDKTDNIVLFGVKLGDSALNAPTGKQLRIPVFMKDDWKDGKSSEFEYEHDSEISGKWSFYYTVRHGIVSSIHAICQNEGNASANFSICRAWIKKNIPIERIEKDDEKMFSTVSKKIKASCQIYNTGFSQDQEEGDFFIFDVSLVFDSDNPDLSK